MPLFTTAATSEDLLGIFGDDWYKPSCPAETVIVEIRAAEDRRDAKLLSFVNRNQNYLSAAHAGGRL